jgi:5-methylcytosine-specific restriction endonuclease McrA
MFNKELYINRPLNRKSKGLYYAGSNKWRLREVIVNAWELGLLRCGYCNHRFNLISNDYPTLDHIIPKSQNGSHNILNLTPCCNKCNVNKGSQTWKVKYPTQFFGVEGKTK